MSTITTTGTIVKAIRAPKTPKVRKTRQCAVKRVFPKAVEGMPTRAYIEAYHAANASVHLTVVEYVCN
jgi:hypothetical protein